MRRLILAAIGCILGGVVLPAVIAGVLVLPIPPAMLTGMAFGYTAGLVFSYFLIDYLSECDERKWRQ